MKYTLVHTMEDLFELTLQENSQPTNLIPPIPIPAT